MQFISIMIGPHLPSGMNTKKNFNPRKKKKPAAMSLTKNIDMNNLAHHLIRFNYHMVCHLQSAQLHITNSVFIRLSHTEGACQTSINCISSAWSFKTFARSGKINSTLSRLLWDRSRPLGLTSGIVSKLSLSNLYAIARLAAIGS